MFSEGIRQRLEALNREPLPAAQAVAPAISSVAPQTRSPARIARRPASPLRPGLVKPIAGLLRRGQVVTNGCGSHLRICLSLDELWAGGEPLVLKRHSQLQNPSGSLPFAGRVGEGVVASTRCDHPSLSPSPSRRGERSDFESFTAAFPDRALLLDLETCGLSGSALFLVGLLLRIDQQLCVELLLARDYSEEPAVLASLWQRVQAEGVIVTFNGKSFDWPMVIDRSRRHLLFRGARPPAPQHIDLLHHARRRWRGQLPDCKLQTLEQHICGRTRADDIPGHMIPAAYQQFVRTGFDREMNSILMHNAIDLVTMLDLAMRLAG